MIDLYGENRNHGFVLVPATCPSRFKSRIGEIRSAILGGRSIPEPSAEYRSHALRFVDKLFKPTTPSLDADAERIENLRRRAQIVGLF